MKKLEKRAIICLAMAAVLILGLLVFTYRFVRYGDDWATFYANQSVYKDGRLAIGSVYDVNGVLLAENGGGTVKYNSDEGIRRGTLHAVGDMDGNISTSALSAFKDDIVGYSLLTGTYSMTGRVVGFGGRILDGDGAKYLNSPESRVFNKRHNLYLLNKAKAAIASKECAILVEGYMDAIRAHLCGYTNTVASLGTALTSVQASLIKRMTGLCYVCYDSDSAGEEAALRAMYILQAEGVTAKRVVWRGGKDPDELLLLPDGRELFEKSIESALPLPLYHVRLRSGALKDPLRAPAARKDLFEGLASLSVFDVSPYIDEISETLGLFPHELKALIDAQRKAENQTARRAEAGPHSAAEAQEAYYEEAEAYGDDIEYMICSLLWNDEEIRASCDMKSVALYTSDESVRAIIYALMSGDEPEALERRWQQMNDEKGIVARGNGLLAREGITAETARKLIDELRLKFIKRNIAPLVAKIKDGSITEAEYMEYLHYTRLLKGGNIKA